MSLYRKSLLLILVLFATVAISVSALSARILYNNLSAEYRNTGIAIVRSLVDAGTETLLNRDLATVQAAVDQFAEVAGVAYVFVTDAGGDVVSHTFVPAIPEPVITLVESTNQRNVSGDVQVVNLELTGVGEVMDIYQPILAGVAGYAHVGMRLEYINAQIRRAVVQQQIVFAGIFLLAALLAFLFTRRIAGPLTILARYTRSLSAQDFSAAVSIPGQVASLASRSKDEVGQLAGAFIDMERTLHGYIKDLQIATAAKERVESELSIAHDIQMGLVPQAFPAYPEVSEFQLHAMLVPARKVGGDFYEFFKVDDEHLCIAIGDVSDKGMPAALFMSLTCTLLRTLGRDPGTTPAAIMSRLNLEISEDNDSCMFVTAFCAFLNLRSGKLVYCNAGHNPPLLSSDTGVAELTGTGVTALGMAANVSYADQEIELKAGDVLVLYTDGITEAMDPSQSQFGVERLKRICERSRNRNPEEFVESISRPVIDFRGNAAQSDDMTLMVLRFLGRPDSAAS